MVQVNPMHKLRVLRQAPELRDCDYFVQMPTSTTLMQIRQLVGINFRELNSQSTPEMPCEGTATQLQALAEMVSLRPNRS